jgi:hypothetical protein
VSAPDRPNIYPIPEYICLNPALYGKLNPMAPMLQFARILGAAAVLAALSFAPSIASAHPGHAHPQAAAQPTPAAQPAAAAQQATAPVSKLVRTERVAALGKPPAPSGGASCGGFGCCSSGPCTGCHGIVLTSMPVPMPPLVSASLAGGSGRADSSPHDGRLRRPPKPFA